MAVKAKQRQHHQQGDSGAQPDRHAAHPSHSPTDGTGKTRRERRRDRIATLDQLSQQLLTNIVQLFTSVRPYTVAAFKTQPQNVVNDLQYIVVLLEACGQTPNYLKQLDAAFTFSMKSDQQAFSSPDTAPPPGGVVGGFVQRSA